MTDGALAERLATDATEPRIVTLPDGSVDTYYDVFDERGERISTRDAFADRLGRGNHESVPLEQLSRESGGQAVNMAKQAHALNAETVCYGHLDDPVFDDLPMETHSMGEPAHVSIFSFDDEDLLLAERSPAVANWSLADLEAASPDPTVGDALDADAICCGNWASVDGLARALETLAAVPLEAGTLVLDPGSIRRRPRGEALSLLDALGRLDERTDVVLSVNETEFGGLVERVEDGSVQADGDRGRLDRVRESAGVSAVVVHAVDAAMAATRGGVRRVETLEVDRPVRRTGAGDRFSAGLAVGRASGWDWETALALGNACAAYAVETASTGTRADLRSFVARRRS
ncbi:PfkB family carbohydrate kinase [Halovivax cerinus]|uniref:PfkB family carbohydrate kinase n=1 Tax=Halovivax cerinus TaxID=1487865 RepID=A0ABD5NL64_9EURY|nr:PfkB family carbohydrate kinase [Halovivax cerinus]